MRKMFVALLTVLMVLVFSVSGFTTIHYFVVDSEHGFDFDSTDNQHNHWGGYHNDRPFGDPYYRPVPYEEIPGTSTAFKSLHHALEYLALYDQPGPGYENFLGYAHNYWTNPEDTLRPNFIPSFDSGIDEIRILMKPGTYPEPLKCRWKGVYINETQYNVPYAFPLTIKRDPDASPEKVRIAGIVSPSDVDWEANWSGTGIFSREWPYNFDAFEPNQNGSFSPPLEFNSGTEKWLGNIYYEYYYYTADSVLQVGDPIPKGELMTHRESFYLYNNGNLVRFIQEFDDSADLLPNHFRIDYDANPKMIEINSTLDPSLPGVDVIVPYNERILEVIDANDFTLENLDFCFGADSFIGDVGVVLFDGDNGEININYCCFNHNSWTGLKLSGNPINPINITGSEASYNGGTGIAVGGWNINMLNNTTNNNNWRGYAAGTMKWVVGGVKMHSARDIQVTGHQSKNNNARGFWLDGCYNNINIDNCDFSNNHWDGLFIEHTTGLVTVSNCDIKENSGDFDLGDDTSILPGRGRAGAGIRINASDHVTISNCCIYDNFVQIKFGLFTRNDGEPQDPVTSCHNKFINNTFRWDEIDQYLNVFEASKSISGFDWDDFWEDVEQYFPGAIPDSLPDLSLGDGSSPGDFNHYRSFDCDGRLWQHHIGYRDDDGNGIIDYWINNWQVDEYELLLGPVNIFDDVIYWDGFGGVGGGENPLYGKYCELQFNQDIFNNPGPNDPIDERDLSALSPRWYPNWRFGIPRHSDPCPYCGWNCTGPNCTVP